MPSNSLYKKFFLKTARTPLEFRETGVLFLEYASWLRIDGNFPQLNEEIKRLPGEYVAPAGEIILAWDGLHKALGCVAVRPRERAKCCELKRLYVRPTSRSNGIGYSLVDAAVNFAASAGYRQMFLDTLPSMGAAIAIYRSLGFEETAPYYLSPGPDALYFCRPLATSSDGSQEYSWRK